jgi:CBS-domain-containing membrane protein
MLVQTTMKIAALVCVGFGPVFYITPLTKHSLICIKAAMYYNRTSRLQLFTSPKFSQNSHYFYNNLQ